MKDNPINFQGIVDNGIRMHPLNTALESAGILVYTMVVYETWAN